MGLNEIEEVDNEGMRAFMRALLEDVQALEAMMAQEDLFESEVRRIGAEQEMFLVDRSLRPANRAPVLLERLPAASFAAELGQFNLEANLSPAGAGGATACPSSRTELRRSRAVRPGPRPKREVNSPVICMTGILPTLEKTRPVSWSR